MSEGPRHTITESPLTESEQKTLRGAAGPHLGMWGCGAVLFLPAAALIVWATGSLSGLFSERARDVGYLVGVVIAVVLVRRGIRAMRAEIEPNRKAAAADLAAGTADEIAVDNARWVQLTADHSSIDPALCCELGGGKLLFLVSQWLWEPELYGASESDAKRARGDDAGERHVNGLLPPHAFPAKAFTLRRARHSGEVFSIRVTGDPVTPEKRGDIEAKAGRYPVSAVVPGKLAKAAHILTAIAKDAATT